MTRTIGNLYLTLMVFVLLEFTCINNKFPMKENAGEGATCLVYSPADSEALGERSGPSD